MAKSRRAAAASATATTTAAAKKAPTKKPKQGKQKDDNEEVYEVETILEHRNVSDVGDEYYVKWVGYPSTQNSWEPSANILAPKLIKEFESRRAKSSAKSPAKSAVTTSKSPAKTSTSTSKSPARPSTSTSKSPAKSPASKASTSKATGAKSPAMKESAKSPVVKTSSTRTRGARMAKQVPSRTRKSLVLSARKSISGLAARTRGIAKPASRGGRAKPKTRGAKGSSRNKDTTDEDDNDDDDDKTVEGDGDKSDDEQTLQADKEVADMVESEEVEVDIDVEGENDNEIEVDEQRTGPLNSTFVTKKTTPKKPSPKRKAAPKKKASPKKKKKPASPARPSSSQALDMPPPNDDDDRSLRGPAAKAKSIYLLKQLKASTRPRKVKTREQKEEEKHQAEMAEREKGKEFMLKQDEVLKTQEVSNLQVINDSSTEKSLTFLGDYRGNKIVIKLDKNVIQEEAVKRALNNPKTKVLFSFVNDVYSEHLIFPAIEINPFSALNALRATVVYPASETSIKKYSRTEKLFFSETAEVYRNSVEPWIETKLRREAEYHQWVYNILDGKSEKDRIVINDTDPDSGFMLVRDLKNIDENYINLLAIPHRRDLRTLRDLNDKHLTLLRNILTKGAKAVKGKFINRLGHGRLRAFIHYHPSFYFFHVHFQLVDPNDYFCSDRDHLLENVISNITLLKDYYQRATLTYPVPLNSDLWAMIEAPN